jgi:hypothetical protein
MSFLDPDEAHAGMLPYSADKPARDESSRLRHAKLLVKIGSLARLCSLRSGKTTVPPAGHDVQLRGFISRRPGGLIGLFEQQVFHDVMHGLRFAQIREHSSVEDLYGRGQCRFYHVFAERFNHGLSFSKTCL